MKQMLIQVTPDLLDDPTFDFATFAADQWRRDGNVGTPTIEVMKADDYTARFRDYTARIHPTAEVRGDVMYVVLSEPRGGAETHVALGEVETR